MVFFKNFFRSLALATLLLSGLSNGTTLTVSTTDGNASSSLLYGRCLRYVMQLPTVKNQTDVELGYQQLRSCLRPFSFLHADNI